LLLNRNQPRFARWKRLGSFKKYQIDDYLQILVAVRFSSPSTDLNRRVVQGLYIALIICLNVICEGGGSNLYPPEMEGTFTESQTKARIYGSKVVLISEQAMLNVIYVLKACVLVMYNRLSLGLTMHKFVKIVAIYVIIGWTATQIAFFTTCRPFSGYWGMPPPDPQCSIYQYYAIVQGCFNISSDLLMLCIPFPMIFPLSMAWSRKIVLLFIFSLGIFVIVAALLTKIFNLTNIWSPEYMLWYIREATVAVYVSNLPFIWPLIREIFPCLRVIGPTTHKPTTIALRKISTTVTAKASQATTKTGSSVQQDAHPPLCSNVGGSVEGAEYISGATGTGGGNIELGEQGAGQRPLTPVAERVRVGDSSCESSAEMGGIQVRHTFMVENEPTVGTVKLDLERGLFDWENGGCSRNNTTLMLGRC
jgi:hypothetical protein